MPDTIAVASSVWNLAGDIARRPDVRKSHIISAIMTPNNSSIGVNIVKSYPNSNAHRIRHYLRWSQTDSDFQEFIGVTSGVLPGGDVLDEAVITANIPVEAGYILSSLLISTISKGQVTYWVQQYIDKYHFGSIYEYTYNQNTNVVTVTLLESSTIETFTPVGFNFNSLYLYVRYNTTTDNPFWTIYKQGSGIPALDALFIGVTPELVGAFYPPIPFRFNNYPVNPDSGDHNLVKIYPTCKRAFKKAFGVNFDDVQEKIHDNPSLPEIDYIYAVLAVSFNTKENSGKKYIYNFFEYLLTHTDNHVESAENNWLANWEDGTSRPTPPWKAIKVESKRAGTSNYRTDIKWAFLHENTGSGLAWPWMQKGDYHFQTQGPPLSSVYTEDDGFNQRVALWYQETETTWRRLIITGLQYNNWVYVTQYTRVTAAQAIGTTGKDSPFLVPLHETMFSNLPTVDQLQLGTSSSYLIFNCYIIDEEEWYESDWFKVIVIVVILVVSIIAAIVTGGSSLGAGGAAIAGLLTGAGISTAAALVIAASVEVLAGILISFLISEIAIALFGEEWGPLIGAIVSFIFSFGMSVGSVQDILTALSKPDVWIGLATATGGGVAAYMQAEAKNIAESTAKMMEQYSQKTAEVQRLYDELNGGGRGDIDPTIVKQYILETSEKPADFFKRTLATGSDIANITLKQIEDFTKMNLQLTIP
jgi:hypothetical protein